jgi:hypothetical protein
MNIGRDNNVHYVDNINRCLILLVRSYTGNCVGTAAPLVDTKQTRGKISCSKQVLKARMSR